MMSVLLALPDARTTKQQRMLAGRLRAARTDRAVIAGGT
jgi:hypothetical protein